MGHSRRRRSRPGAVRSCNVMSPGSITHGPAINASGRFRPIWTVPTVTGLGGDIPASLRVVENSGIQIVVRDFRPLMPNRRLATDIGQVGLILSRDTVAGERKLGHARIRRPAAGRSLDCAAGMTSTVQPAAGSARGLGGQITPGVAVDLDGYAIRERHDHFLDPAMEHARIVKMGSAKDLPEIIQSLKRSRFAKNNHVEPAVVVACRRDKRQAQGIAGRVEDEDRRAGQDLLGSGVDDPHRDRWEPVRETRSQDRPDVSDPVGGPDRARRGTRGPDGGGSRRRHRIRSRP